jgi:hypothetical protein
MVCHPHPDAVGSALFGDAGGGGELWGWGDAGRRCWHDHGRCKAVPEGTASWEGLKLRLDAAELPFVLPPPRFSTGLSGSSRADRELRRMLVEDQRLDAVASLPGGVFRPDAGDSTATKRADLQNAGNPI